MSLATADGASPALQDLHERFSALRAGYEREVYPTYRERRDRVARLTEEIRKRQSELAAAMSADFGHRSRHESLIADVWVTVGAGRHILQHLKGWMRPESRPTILPLRPATGRIVPQPLGVVGIIAPWNYPLMLAAVPALTALAAGNRVLIKTSEFSPRTSALFAEMIAALFPADVAHVMTGDAALGSAFASLPFDHLFFTGSTRVGKLVMAAAAENLTPVTLELGGKSPAIVHPDYPLRQAAEAIAYGKTLNAGQSCVAPDYVLVGAGQADAFTAAFVEQVERMYPSLRANPDYTAVAHERHKARLMHMVADARERGAEVVEINPAGEDLSDSPKVQPFVFRRATDDMLILQEEIFGPLLPILEVDDLEAAARYVRARPRPLAMYVFDRDAARVDRLVTRTHAGSVAVNDTMIQFGNDALPFGGVGASGMGRYHGKDGFDTFSHRKAVMYQSRVNGRGLIAPPFGHTVERLIAFFIGRG